MTAAPPILVLSVVSELFPFVKTGGLADVAGALPGALAPENVRTVTLVPGYPAVLAALREPSPVLEVADLFGGPARLVHGRARAVELIAIDAPHLYDRPGNPYMAADGRDWPDNAVRFGALGLMAARLASGEVPALRPDILHAHDWQAGLAAAYLRYRFERRPRTVMTVHNLAFQGLFPASLLASLALPPQAFSINGVEFHGEIGFLKAGLALSDWITTVSPTYAAEIRTREYGMGLDGLLRGRTERLSGILNGIDDAVWNPSRDPLIAANFDARRIAPRIANKAVLKKRMNLAADDALLFGVVSRLTWQKGLDMLVEVLPTLLATGSQLVVLGSGERNLQQAFLDAARIHPGRVACVIGYDEELAHLIQAGADALLMPSRYEPCGLAQMCALRYGTLPVVSHVGGLADTVIDCNDMAIAEGVGTGIQFTPTIGMLEAAVLRTTAMWRNGKTWRRVQRNAMRADVSWRRSARRYAQLYRDLMAERRR
ncbi:glycogen synthase GlgA [Rhodoplanes tepidamans]|uniref:Glycogen synthase n=1 Tax=Rhodoplanes tepidamans TaxID=200616 RepID=A0ABT5J3B3_RHOTP|nr:MULTISPECIES: glycogen synthase GlgA [Rhodoplanes]MDC7784157.1 glycogen synthase GlgA [Rhodoplanes tepidamans]